METREWSPGWRTVRRGQLTRPGTTTVVPPLFHTCMLRFNTSVEKQRQMIEAQLQEAQKAAQEASSVMSADEAVTK